MASGEYSNCSTSSGMGSSWHDLSKSDYAKVIFSDLYYNPQSSVGCRFQITDNVHEDPCDYVGLFKVGYDNLSECLVSKLLSQTECEEDGKLLRCTFKISELPALEGGYYQFLYVTRDNEVCGASLPFAIGHTVHMTKDSSSDEDVVADRTEDDFLVVRSNLAEKNRQLESLLDKMTRTYMTLEDKLMKNFKEEVEKKQKLEEELKFIHSEMDKFSEKCKLIAVEHCIMYTSNEAVIEFLQRKVALLESQLADADHRIKELEVMKTALEDEKNRAICEKIRLQETVDELKSTSELKNAETAEIKYMMERKNEDKIAEVYEDRNMLSSQLENAQVMIKALEESKQLVMNEMSQMSAQVAELSENHTELTCENINLSLKLKDSDEECRRYKRKNLDLLSELSALKMHFLEIQSEMNQDEPAPAEKLKTTTDFKCEKLLPLQEEMQVVFTEAKEMKCFADIPHEDILKLSDLKHRNGRRELRHYSDVIEATKKNYQKLREEMEHMKTENKKLHCELDERNSIISELKNEALKKDAVIEFLCTEKNNIQKTAAAFESNYNDCIMRLKQASEIYRKQYLEIQKLKKKLEKARSNPTVDEKKSAGVKALGSLLKHDWCVLNKSEGKKDSEGQRRKYSRSKTTGSISECSSAQNQSSDSDTGEHVLRHHVEKKNANDCPCLLNELRYPEDFLKKFDVDLQGELSSSIPAYKEMPEISDVASETSEPSAPKSRESPELQSMIEQNLAKLSNSCSNQPSTYKSEVSLDQQTVSEQSLDKPSSSSFITAEQVMYTLPCPVCDGDIGVEGSSTEEMVKHLEVQHKQQMCPVCGRLFDMTLPEKYFMFHVEDHFMKRK